MRIKGVIYILLLLMAFSMALGSLMGLHYSLSTGTFYWEEG